MRTVSVRLVDLNRVTLQIGFVGENLHRRVQIDSKKAFDEYPDAVPALTVKPPVGDIYSPAVTRSGNIVIWDIEATDVASEGDGEIQLDFVQGNTLMKSYTGKTKIGHSIVPGGGGGGGGTTNYNALSNKPQIGGKELVGDQTPAELGIATPSDIPDVSGFYTKPASGIPASDIAEGVIPDVSNMLEAPATPGTQGQVLTSDGNGGQSWEDPTGGDPTELLDDTAGEGDTNKTWSADKLHDVTSQLSTDITKLTTATASDVGKALSPKTVSNGQVTEWKFVSAGGGGGGGSDIDDTAGAGDTDKAWSADKLTTKFDIVEDLQEEVSTGYITSFKQGKASEINGTIDETDTSRCYSGLLDMHKGDSYTFSRSVNKITTTSYLAVYDTTGTFISGRSLVTGNTVTFDNDGKFAITCALNTGVSATMQEAIEAANSSFNATFDTTKKIVKVIDEHGDDISSINVEIGRIKGIHFTKNDLKTGAYYAISNGKAVKTTDSTAKYCDLIDVSAYKGSRLTVHMNTRKSGSTRAFGLCDADGNVGNYSTETIFMQVSDGGYYKVLLIDEDYMFFSCSGDPTDIDIRIIDSSNMLTEGGYQKEKQTNKFYHMSFDDVILCLQDITTNVSTYDSIFDNDLFAWCKKMHDTYGTTFSMYVFFTDGTWTLESCTSAFANEFTENADWLKFGLHSYSTNISYDSSGESRAATDYGNAISELLRITGSVNCIDRVPRLHEYKGTLTALKAIRDCDLGCVGFIASADTNLTTPRDSYYFNADENAYIYNHVYMHDSENHLHFVKTSYLWCSSDVSITNKENTAQYFNRNKYVEVFMHENQLTSGMKEAFESKFLQLSYSHLPYFMMDLVLTS